MYEKKIERRNDCGVEMTMEVIGGKWKPYIICYIAKGVRRPSELQKEITYVTKRVLAQQLKELEEHKIIYKKVSTDTFPLRSDYFLTLYGEELAPILKQLVDWGDAYKLAMQKEIRTEKTMCL